MKKRLYRPTWLLGFVLLPVLQACSSTAPYYQVGAEETMRRPLNSQTDPVVASAVMVDSALIK